MNVSRDWIEDWHLGVFPSREREISTDLVRVFAEFWDAARLSEKSTTTKRRYAAGLHALGGYIVSKAVDTDGIDRTALELLADAVDDEEGPLIHYDNEAWQSELDTVCRRLNRFLKSS